MGFRLAGYVQLGHQVNERHHLRHAYARDPGVVVAAAPLCSCNRAVSFGNALTSGSSVVFSNKQADIIHG